MANQMFWPLVILSIPLGGLKHTLLMLSIGLPKTQSPPVKPLELAQWRMMSL